MKIERRQVEGSVELRTTGETKAIVGYAGVYSTEAVIAGMWREQIAPGAFRSVIGPTADVRALFNHDANMVLGRTTAGTLRLSEDDKGLRYEIDPPNTSVANDLMESLRRGDISQSSYGFRVKRDEWTKADRAGGLPLRTIHEYEELQDVSPVTFPAFEETTAEARSAASDVLSRALPAADEDPMTAEEAALMAACRSCADCCAAVVTAGAALVADEENGSMARECVSACASLLQTCGRAMASLSGQDIYSYYSSALATERARVDLLDLD